MSESKEIKLKGRPKKNTDKEPYKNTVFCNRLNTLFYNRKESQEAAAKVFNTSRQTFGNWLAGRNQPDFETLIKIAKYYNVSTDYLLGITNVSSIDNEVRTAVEVTGLSEKALENIRVLCGKSSTTWKSNLSHRAVMFMLESEHLTEIARALGRTDTYYKILDPSAELTMEVFYNTDDNNIRSLALSAIAQTGFEDFIINSMKKAVNQIYDDYRKELENGKHK